MKAVVRRASQVHQIPQIGFPQMGPVTIPMVLAADGFSQLLKKTPTVTRVLDYVFAGVFSAFAIKILTAQAR